MAVQNVVSFTTKHAVVVVVPDVGSSTTKHAVVVAVKMLVVSLQNMQS